MTTPITLVDLDLPEVLVDPDDGTEWHLSNPSVELEVAIVDPESDTTPADARRRTYPLDTIDDKIEHGDLVAQSAESDESDDTDDSAVCETCGSSFDSKQALGGHMPCPEAPADDDDD